MNKVILIGRLTKEVTFSTTQQGTEIARFTLAVDRYGKDKGADFLNCVAFGQQAKFADNYFKKGMKVAITGRLQTGSYKNREGQTVYTTDVIIETQEFCERKEEGKPAQAAPTPTDSDGFMQIPDDIDEELPFK